MEETFGYRYNPNYVPEPKFVPGYSGHLPRVLTKYGTTYGNASHHVLRNDPLVSARLAPLKPPGREKEDPLHCKCQKGFQHHREGIISDQETMLIPYDVCPGYTGCLTLKRKGVPRDLCCDKVLRSLGCEQDPYEYSGETGEDPFPGPPRKFLDHTQEGRRCNDGLWKRFPKDYTTKELYKWM